MLCCNRFDITQVISHVFNHVQRHFWNKEPLSHLAFTILCLALYTHWYMHTHTDGVYLQLYNYTQCLLHSLIATRLAKGS